MMKTAREVGSLLSPGSMGGTVYHDKLLFFTCRTVKLTVQDVVMKHQGLVAIFGS